MPKDIQSIENLLIQSDDNSIQAKLTAKQKEIKIREEERALKKNSQQRGVPYINLFGFPISPEALALIDEETAKKLSTVCFFYNGKKIRLASTHPDSGETKRILNELMKKYYAEGKIFQISERSLHYAFELYKIIPKPRKRVSGIELTVRDLDKFSERFSSFKDLQAEIDKAQITDIVTMIMAASVKTNASDVHIEGEEKSIKVRFRIDGVLHDAAVIKKDLWDKIITRMKVLAKVKINVTDRPQDGRLSIITQKNKIDIRVSFLPTNFGESVVMRLFRPTSTGLVFEDLGLRGRAFVQLRREIRRPNGMVVTTGPTGSGKTTTLYAILKKLNKPETKIITIEDPIEYQLAGINQSQVSEKFTFARGLRSIVRQDPDVLMVGEIRDLETAEIAVQAALTGHLVLSTIHTNDAAGTVPRLLSMGTKPFLLAPALNAMIGQRLVRRICEHCKVETQPDRETVRRVMNILAKLPLEDKKNSDFNRDNPKLKFYTGRGCEKCQGIGYKGRIGIYEVMAMNPKIEKLILSNKVSEYELRDLAVENGMITMVQDGLLKAVDGITSLDEVFRVAEEK